MSRRIITIICALQIANPVWACDTAKDILQNPNGSYNYTRECHIFVGKQIEELEIRKEQVEDLKKSLDLKDLALQKSHERTELWMDTSLKLEDRVHQIEQYKDKQKWYWFALGVVVTGAAVWGAGQLND